MKAWWTPSEPSCSRWIGALHQNDADAAGVEKRHLAVWQRGEVLHAHNFGVEALAAFHIAHRNGEVRNALDVDHRLFALYIRLTGREDKSREARTPVL